jgi:prolyl oligopeptidase
MERLRAMISRMLSGKSVAHFSTFSLFFALSIGFPFYPARAKSNEIGPIPQTPRVPAVQNYFDRKVTDDYLWLENPDDAKVVAWTKAQTARSVKYLDAIPERQSFLNEFRQNVLGKTVRYGEFFFAGGRVFAAKYEPPKAQPVIVSRPGLEQGAEETVVFDPVQIDSKGLTSFDWFVPSPDGSLVALSLSESGSESGTLRFVHVSDGKLLDDRVDRVQFATAGGSAAWTADGKGIIYTRYPGTGERPENDLSFYQRIFFHELGTPDSNDRYELGKEFPRIAEISLILSPGGGWILATVKNGDGGEHAHYLRDKSGKWTQITQFADGVKRAVFGGDNQLFLLSVKGALRGQVLRLDLSNGAPTIEQAKVIVPEAADSAVQDLAASADDLLVNDIVGGPSRVRHFGSDGTVKGTLPITELSSVSGMDVTEAGEFLVGISSYTKADSNVLYNPKTNEIAATSLENKIAVNFDDIEEQRVFAISKDGTKVPISILIRKGAKLNGTIPTILYGYGGYGLSSLPEADPYLRSWFDRGGAYAVANIRGGGEYGEPWHRAGMLLNKQNVLDDFAACAQFLIGNHYTTSNHLGVWGISNGGITAGGFITQHPGLARAAVINVGVLDVIRSELEPNGAFNVTEYGTVNNPEQFAALYGYSPYHHVEKGVKYPAVLMTAGENDHRVASWHAKKMAAKLQLNTASPNPILLKVSTTAGHGFGTSFDERLQDSANTFAFFYDQLGMGRIPAK